MNKEPIQMTPGDDLHLTLLMAPLSLNFVTGQDREHLLAFGRAAFEAGQSSKCLHQIAEPSANLASELADMLERSITGLGHYRNTERWSEADEEHINECNALLERFNSSDDEHEAAPQAVQAAVPSDAEIDAAIQAFDWEGWTDPEKAKRAFTREALSRRTAATPPAEGVPAANPEDAAALLEKYRKLCIEIG
ncbi:hypothetical protein [Comamonas sp.]|uniref:hypothetical protein n=1 Tax=Comamonas sp. TaxID=34028 RepID=UPI0025877006|nr:hypothetical protein [Comamonas sp.]